MDAQESVGRRRRRGKKMTNDIAIRDDMKQVERWENEGGRVSPLNYLWASLKRFTREDNSRERQMIDARKHPQHQPGVFSRFNMRRAVQ